MVEQEFAFSMSSSPPSVLFMSLDSRLGGGQPQRWKLSVQSGLVAEAGNWVYSAMAEAFYL